MKVLPKSATTIGWYHPYLLAFFVCASPLARQRSAWSMVAEAAPPGETPTKLRKPFDVSTITDAASENKEGGVGTPKTKEGVLRERSCRC